MQDSTKMFPRFRSTPEGKTSPKFCCLSSLRARIKVVGFFCEVGDGLYI